LRGSGGRARGPAAWRERRLLRSREIGRAAVPARVALHRSASRRDASGSARRRSSSRLLLDPALQAVLQVLTDAAEELVDGVERAADLAGDLAQLQRAFIAQGEEALRAGRQLGDAVAEARDVGGRGLGAVVGVEDRLDRLGRE